MEPVELVLDERDVEGRKGLAGWVLCCVTIGKNSKENCKGEPKS